MVDLWNCRARRAALEHWVKCGRRRDIEDILKVEKRARQLNEMRVEDNNVTKALESYARRSSRDTVAPTAAPSHYWFMISEMLNRVLAEPEFNLSGRALKLLRLYQQ